MKKVYLKFNQQKCDRKKEIDLLVNFYGVVKMPIINDFPKMIQDNTSIYQIILKEDGDYNKLEEYFEKNKAVKRIYEEDLEKFRDPEFYKKLEEEKRKLDLEILAAKRK